MFIKKDLRKIPTILDEAVDCHAYDAACGDENDPGNSASSSNAKTTDSRTKKRTKLEEPLRMLKLGRRKQEFEGTVQVLCQPRYAPKLHHLEVLNLYDCEIHDLEGLGRVFKKSSPNLETLNLGRNPLSKGIPDDFCQMKSLKHLWLDDCGLTGAFPQALLHLPNIESLRLPNNQITHLEIGGKNANRTSRKHRADDDEEFEFDDGQQEEFPPVIPLLKLKTLCLDRNRLGEHHQEEKVKPTDADTKNSASSDRDVRMDLDEDPPLSSITSPGGSAADATDDDGSPTLLPSNFAEWAPNLKECFLRHNNFARLGVDRWPESLEILHLSSNNLTKLDELGEAPALTHLYANGNALESLPTGILTHHPGLQRLVVSHNPPLRDLPPEVWQRLREERDAGGEASCRILWKPNPGLRAPWDTDEEASEGNTANMHVC